MYQWETTSLAFRRPWITLPTETSSKEEKFKLDHTTGWQLNFDWSEKPDGTFRLTPGSEERGNHGERSGNQADGGHPGTMALRTGTRSVGSKADIRP